MGLFDALSRGLERSRETLNEVFYFGGEVSEEFWEDLEDTLVMDDMGAEIAMKLTDELREIAARKNLKTSRQLRCALAARLEDYFVPSSCDPISQTPSCVLFVGINGAGKTTTVGKIASKAVAAGKRTVIGSADTFRAAAIEQLDIWGERAGVPVVKRTRGADPASVCYDVLDEADRIAADLVLIDTAGRLHTSADLMRELAKVVNVTRKRAERMRAGPMAVHVVLVIDATTGQNGLAQASRFNDSLGLDGVIMTKLDGTAKGGIALAVASKLELPILAVGVGEQVDDLQTFDAGDFSRALVGTGEE
ncbi:signal recognition particle-docking protein FtsY [Coriobacterium glomerans PW2]|uniref:Signal recognition particle-docking protein FtsY n=1 Tax=Coriobacterium glomerans (strain ATCC 49209 / DSM 20642 / JCM 10262 / PW2) TaxID=700015 RepID=F2N9Q5_CORGP|nr:signal recognition particle-docking protein FtsY [Coriobacterium glomerans]AEB07158.1 signal recognition particle-docking protein FtsY [Coriobacterium glomerans PW2]